MYKAIIAALALSAPAMGLKKPAHGAAALRVRGGTFGFDAHQTGEQCGIEEPEKEVVKTIKTAITYPFKVLGIRGGSDEADEGDEEDDVDVDEEEASDFR